LQITRIETFVQKLLADENDARAAQLETLPGQWPSHLLLTVFDQSDYIPLDADAQAMPLSVVHPNAKIDLDGRASVAFVIAFLVSERHGFSDRDDQLLIAGVIVNGEQNRVDALGRPQRRHDAQVIGESLLKDLSGGNGENGSLGEPIGLIGSSVDGHAILDGFRPLVTNARRVYHAQWQLANAYGFQQIGRIWRQGGVNGQRYPANPADDGRDGRQRGPRIAARTPRSGSHSPYLNRVGGTLMRLKSC